MIAKYLRNILAVLNVIWLIGVIIYAAYVWIYLPLDERNTLYWFHQSIHYVPQMVLLIVALNGVLFLIYFVLSIRRKPQFSQSTIFMLIPIISIACIFSCIVSLPIILGEYTLHDEIRTSEHVYRLDSEWKVGIGGASTAIYHLWQCDYRGWFCRIFDSKRIPPIYSQDAYESTTATLEQNSETGMIEIYLP